MQRSPIQPPVLPPAIPDFVILGLACVQLGINFFAPSVSIIYGFVLVSVIIWSARAEYIPALLVTMLSRSNFILEGYGTDTHLVENFEANTIVIAGIPLSVAYMLAAVLVLRVLWEFVHCPDTISGTWHRVLAALWVTALPFSVVMCVLGWLDGNPSWTIPVRVTLTSTAYFYGLILAKSFSPESRMLERWLLPMSLVLYVLASLAHFHHRMLWFLTGLVVPIVVLAFRRPGLVYKAVALGTVAATGYYSLGFGRSVREEEVVGGLIGSGGSTFTLNALFGLSLGLTILIIVLTPSCRRMLSVLAGFPTFLLVVLFSLFVAYMSPRILTSGVTNADIETMTIMQRLQAKVFADRGVIWEASLDDICTAPYFLKPSGRPILVNNPRWGLLPWYAGSHNSILEHLRVNGWYAGVINLLFMMMAMIGAAKAFLRPGFDAIHVLAIAVLANVMAGATTGDYLAVDVMAVVFLAFGGIARSWADRSLVGNGRRHPLHPAAQGMAVRRQWTRPAGL